MTTALLALSLLCAAPAHRGRAEKADTLGHNEEAAREYEAAFEEEHAPELLYRLGLARRRLKQWARAKAAFRGYLRAAPEGGLRDEVERQLAQLAVVMDAEQEPGPERSRKKRKKPAAAQPGRPDRAATPSGAPLQAPLQAPGEPLAQAASQAPGQTSPHEPAPTSSQPPAQAAGQGPAPEPPGEASARAAPERAPPESVAEATNSPRGAAAAPGAAAARVVAAPAQATAASPATLPARRAAVPWVLVGGGALSAAGGVLWWNGGRISRDLDGRFASGELTPADGPRYGRARTQSIAGRALALAGATLVVTAAVLWW